MDDRLYFFYFVDGVISAVQRNQIPPEVGYEVIRKRHNQIAPQRTKEIAQAQADGYTDTREAWKGNNALASRKAPDAS